MPPKKKKKTKSKSYQGCSDCGKTEKARLGGSTVKFKKGGLHKSLNVPMSYTFTIRTMQALKKKKKGETFSFQGKKIKMTDKILKHLTLGINLMKRK